MRTLPRTEVRVPPHDLDAEESVLGAMLLSRTACSEVLETLRSGDDFYRPTHGKIFDAIRDLFARGEAVDAVTVVDELRRRGDLEQVGGAPYLHTLLQATPTAANALHYARIVGSHATLRRLIDAGTQIAQEAFDVPEDVDMALARAEELVYGVANRRGANEVASLRDLLDPAMERIEGLHARGSEITGLPTGFTEVDRKLAGLQPGNLIIVAARPAMGKSTFAINVAHHVVKKERQPAIIFSLEMSREEITQRIVCAESSIDLSHVRSGRMTDTDWRRLVDGMGRLADSAPLLIDDTSTITLSEIRARCRRQHAREGLSLVVVDYLQLMQSPRRTENRVQEVAEISRGLKILAKELEVPVIAVSQLSRQLEQTGAKPRKPRLADLRESGALEQDADVVMFISRDDYYDEESERKGEADILIEKHRNGPTGIATLAFLRQYTRFDNLART
ncbi:MAG: replicative DNA helicase [Actinomycetota bacterium]